MIDKTSQEFSLILLKPDAYERNLVDVILQAIKDEKLNIVYQKKILLSEKMLRGYQPLLNEPNDEGKVDWQYDIINAYTKEPTDVYLLEGQDAIKKTNKIKSSLREKYISGEKKYTIYNLLHSVDDQDDLELNVKILLPEKLDLVKRRTYAESN